MNSPLRTIKIDSADNQPLVSVLIPHFLNGGFLRDLISSIPIRADIEVIIFNDGYSSIESAGNLGRELNRNITIINSSENVGAGSARNRLLNHASGLFVIFADSDDVFVKDNLIGLIEFIYKNKTCDVILFDVNDFGLGARSGKQAENRSRVSRYRIDNLKSSLKKGSDKTSLIREYYPPWGKAISLKFIIQECLSFEEVKYSNDILFSLKLFSRVRTLSIHNRVVYKVREHDNSLTKCYSAEASKIRINEAIKYNGLANDLGLSVRVVWMREHVFNLIRKLNLGCLILLSRHLSVGVLRQIRLKCFYR